MGLEKLVKALDFVTTPFRLPDRAVKIAYDAVSEWQENNGRDRYTLAQYSGVVLGASAGAIGIVLPFSGYPAGGLCLAMGPVLGIAFWDVASKMREYAFQKGIDKTLDFDNEFLFSLGRVARLPVLLTSFSTATAMVKEPFAALPAAVMFGIASYAYFIDGNTSGYENTKNFARNTFNAIGSLLPKRAPQPSQG